MICILKFLQPIITYLNTYHNFMYRNFFYLLISFYYPTITKKNIHKMNSLNCTMILLSLLKFYQIYRQGNKIVTKKNPTFILNDSKVNNLL